VRLRRSFRSFFFHELRNPLATAMGLVEVMRESDAGPPPGGAMKNVAAAAAAMATAQQRGPAHVDASSSSDASLDNINEMARQVRARCTL
jgi:signal transduction histidine kinase